MAPEDTKKSATLLYSKKRVAVLAGICRPTLNKWIAQRRIPKPTRKLPTSTWPGYTEDEKEEIVKFASRIQHLDGEQGALFS